MIVIKGRIVNDVHNPRVMFSFTPVFISYRNKKVTYGVLFMKQLNITTSDDLFKQVENASSAFSLSKSELVNLILGNYFKENQYSIDEKIIDSTVANNKSFHLKMDVNLYETLKNIAAINGMSISSEIRFRIVSTLSNNTLLTEDELNKLQKNAVQLSRIGSNINVISRAINQNKVTDLNDECKNILNEIMPLLKENLDVLKTFRESRIDRFNFKVKNGAKN